MNNLTGSEEIVEVAASVETEVIAAPLKGLAFKINQQINALIELLPLATTLESGLKTKASIKTTGTALRVGLYSVKTNVHTVYKGSLTVSKDLLENIGEVQADAKKAALEKQIMDAQKTLDSM